MNFHFSLAARYLFGRKLRTFLTTVAVVFGVLVIFGMNILLPTMLQAFQSSLMAAADQVDASLARTTGEGFSPDVAARVAGVEGVRVSAGFLIRNLNLPADYLDHDPARSDTIGALTLVGLEPEAARTVRSYPVAEGRFLQGGDTQAAVVTRSLAQALGLGVGDALVLPTAAGEAGLTIVGLLPERKIPGNEEVLLTLADAQRLVAQPGLINRVEANYATADVARRAEIQASLLAAVGPGYAVGGLGSGADLFASLKLGQAAMNLFGFLALFMGAFIIFNTFRTVVAERRRDIGLLRAVGASRRTIIGLILIEGLLQGIVGTAVGMGLGYLLGLGVIRAMGPIGQEYLHLNFGDPVVSPALVVMTIVLGLGATLLAGLLPAVSASRVTPLEALRPTAATAVRQAVGVGAIVGGVMVLLGVLALLTGNIAFTGLGGLLFLIGLVLVTPALVGPFARTFGALAVLAFARQGTGVLAQGNLTRQPSRAAVTASATMIGLAIIVAVGGVATSLTGGFLAMVRSSLGSDYLFLPPAIAVWGNNVGAGPELAERLRAVDGVGAVSTLRYAAARVLEPAPVSGKGAGAPLSLLGIDPVLYQAVAGMVFEAGTPEAAFGALGQPGARAIIANGPFAAALGLRVGDELLLETAAGPQRYSLVAIANDYLNAKIVTAYISQDNLAADYNKTEDVMLQLNLAPGANAAQVEPALLAILADYPQFKMASGDDYYEENKQLFDATFAMFYVLVAVLALPSLIALLNTLAIGVIERTREIGMLRAVGATQSQVRRMVLVEALLLAGLGTAFGLLGGLYLGYVMVQGLSFGGFSVDYSFPLAGLVVAVAVGLLFGVAAALLPARQAARLEIVRALRYE